jgi:hypothetical protein
MSDLRANPVRLDAALEALAASGPEAEAAPQVERFDLVLKARDRLRDDLRPPSLVDEVFDFIMPRIGDPLILRNSRYVSLLQDLADAFGDDGHGDADDSTDEIGRAAGQLLREELRKHRVLRQQLNSLIEP